MCIWQRSLAQILEFRLEQLAPCEMRLHVLLTDQAPLGVGEVAAKGLELVADRALGDGARHEVGVEEVEIARTAEDQDHPEEEQLQDQAALLRQRLPDDHVGAEEQESDQHGEDQSQLAQVAEIAPVGEVHADRDAEQRHRHIQHEIQVFSGHCASALHFVADRRIVRKSSRSPSAGTAPSLGFGNLKQVTFLV